MFQGNFSYAQFPHDIFFEVPDTIIQIDTSNVDNIWQIGKPSKIIFDSAYSSPNAIVTDTLNYYPVNNLSTFTIKFTDSIGDGLGLNFIFYHRFDTDSLFDGGYIEASYDGGITWINITDDHTYVYYLSFWNNPLIANGNSAFTGKSNGWEFASIMWCGYNSPRVPIYLRFVFSSDSIQNNRDGWMIDNIEYVSNIVCEGINETQNDRLIFISPNPTSDYITINNKSNSHLRSLIIYDVTGKNIYERNIFNDDRIDIRQLNSGIYFLKLIAGERSIIKRLVILK